MILQRFDEKITAFIQELPHWISPFMHVAAYIGHPLVFVLLSLGLIVTGYLQQMPRFIVTGVVVLAAISSSSLLKILINRTRPINDYTEGMLTMSFPSGHAVASLIGYGLIAYFIYTRVPGATGAAIAIALAVLGLFVGISRIYIGAHYPTDVLGGWLLGVVVLAIIIFIVRP